MLHKVEVEAVEAELDEATRHVMHVEPRVTEGYPLTHDAVAAGGATGCAVGLDSKRACWLAIGAREPRRTQVPRSKGSSRGRVRRGKGDLVRRDEPRKRARWHGDQARGPQHGPQRRAVLAFEGTIVTSILRYGIVLSYTLPWVAPRSASTPPGSRGSKNGMMGIMFLSAAAMATPGWPSCVDSCSGHGNCSHIGVCSCERGWRGDACAEAVCAAHCARHGICVAGNAGASCACDAGYVGADCSRRAPPPPPPFGSEMQARQLGEVPPGPPVHHNFTVSSRLDGLPRVLQPVGALLPSDAVSAFLMNPGTAGKKPLLLHVRLGQQLKLADSHDVDDSAFLPETHLPPVVTLARRAPSHSDTGIASALQPDSAVRTATASAVDWGRGTAYVALSTGNSGGPALLQLGMCLPTPHSTACLRAAEHACHWAPFAVSTATLPAAALPSMNALARRPLGGVDMVEVSSLALSASSHLFAALADASGRQAELLVLRLPEMQPLHATRFAVPSAVRAILVDAHSDWLYLLCAQPRPRLLRVHREYGLSAVPGTQPEAVNLPWSAALPLLLPFPEQRQLLLLAAADPAVPQSGLRVCRLWLGESLAKASPPTPTPACAPPRSPAVTPPHIS